MTSLLPKLVADFKTQLADGVSIGDTTSSIASQTDGDLQTLPDGKWAFTIDGASSSKKEYILCTKTGVNLSSVQNISRQGVITTGFAKEHRTGATVTVTDWATLLWIKNLLSGTTDLDSSTPLKYDGVASLTPGSNQLATVAYVDGVAIAGAPKASDSTYGIVKLSVAATVALAPVVVGDNDPRLPINSYAASATGNDSYAITLPGSALTAYATGQQFIFKADVANTGACTLNVSGLGAKNIKAGGVTPTDSIIRANSLVKVIYNGTDFDIISISDDGKVTFSADSKLVRTETNGRFNKKVIPSIGGDGSDGALTVSSGNTVIDLGGVENFTKNYSSISITGTGYITFTNPHNKGTVIRLLCTGDVTITSSAAVAIDLDSLGSLGGVSGNNGYDVSFPLDGVAHKPSGVSSNGTAFGRAEQYMSYSVDALWQFRSKALQCGVGGAGADSQGGAYFSNTSSGGRGGGALLIECAGALNFTGTITAKGQSGTSGVPQAGGPGGGGNVVIIYNTLTANSGTVTVTGGAASTCTNPGGIGYGYCCGGGPGLAGAAAGTPGALMGAGLCPITGGNGQYLIVQNKYF